MRTPVVFWLARIWRKGAGMQTRPLLSSVPITVDMNGWTDPDMNDTPPSDPRGCSAGGSAVVRSFSAHPWDSMGYHGTETRVNEKS